METVDFDFKFVRICMTGKFISHDIVIVNGSEIGQAFNCSAVVSNAVQTLMIVVSPSSESITNVTRLL